MKKSKMNFDFRVNADSSVTKFSFLISFLSVLFLILVLIFFIIHGATTPTGDPSVDSNEEETTDGESTPTINTGEGEYPFRQQISNFIPTYSESALTFNSEEINSQNAILVNVSTGEVIRSQKSNHKVYPASLTKVMSLIVVYDNLKSEDELNKKLTISEETWNRMTSEGSSGFGFTAGESYTVKDLIYAMVHQSDGMATVTLAEYIAGSEAEFAELMNKKADDMRLKGTHFTNATGLHSDDHYSTCQSLAAIMTYAMKNTFCAEVLTNHSYRTYRESTEEYITFYNTFFNGPFKNESHPSTGKITAAKTGNTDEAKSCLVSYMVGSNGNKYAIVTIGAEKRDLTVKDHLHIYENYAK